MNKQYYEVIFEGSFDLVRGFVLGFLEGKGIEGEAIFERKHHIKSEEKLEHLLHLVRLKGDQAYIIIRVGLHELLKKALNNRRHELNLRIVSVREIVNADFNFTYKAYAKQFGDELKELLSNLPEETHITDYEPKETIRSGSKGIEAYAPEHDYEIKASGKVSGPAKQVIAFYSRIERHQLVKLGEINLRF